MTTTLTDSANIPCGLLDVQPEPDVVTQSLQESPNAFVTLKILDRQIQPLMELP